jgi:hypothetical protein
VRSSPDCIVLKIRYTLHVKLVPCHHGMARPHVADGGDVLQILRVASKILNKHSRTADKGWPYILGVGSEATTPPVKSNFVTKYYKGPRTCTDSVDK